MSWVVHNHELETHINKYHEGRIVCYWHYYSQTLELTGPLNILSDECLCAYNASVIHTVVVIISFGSIVWTSPVVPVLFRLCFLTSDSSEGAADSQRPVFLCCASPWSVERVSGETDWERTGRSKATAAASPAPCWTCVKNNTKRNRVFTSVFTLYL